MSFYEDDEAWMYAAPEYVHKNDVPDTSLMADRLRDIVKQLYSSAPLDKAMLESNLDDLCDLLEVDINKGDLQIERRGTIHKYFAPIYDASVYPLAQNQ